MVRTVYYIEDDSESHSESDYSSSEDEEDLVEIYEEEEDLLDTSDAAKSRMTVLRPSPARMGDGEPEEKPEPVRHAPTVVDVPSDSEAEPEARFPEETPGVSAAEPPAKRARTFRIIK